LITAVAAALTGSLATALTSCWVCLTLTGLIDLLLGPPHCWLLALFEAGRFLVQHVRGVFLHLGLGLLLLLAHQLVGIAVALDPQGRIDRLVLHRLVEVALGLEHAGLRTGRQQTQGQTQNPCTHHHFLSFKTGKGQHSALTPSCKGAGICGQTGHIGLLRHLLSNGPLPPCHQSIIKVSLCHISVMEPWCNAPVHFQRRTSPRGHMHSTASSAPQQIRRPGPLFNWLAVITLIYLILVAVGAVSHGFKGFSGGAEGAAQIFAFANNPFVALLLGILATALVQSSSTVTSVIVGLVAGGLPMAWPSPW
jgi:hypothetical protein